MSELFDSSDLSSRSGPASLLKERYEIRKKLGQGGFADTYLAYDRNTSELCVLKELSWKKVDDWKIIELFEREAKVLANLNHPQIPKFIDFFSNRTDAETKIYLVQEYIRGKNLAELIQEGKHFTEREILEIALKSTNILEYLHSLSPPIIHRDIKPSNILFDSDGELHLVDFGAVRDKVLHTQKTEAAGYTVVGTYGYMPFEQFQGQALPASDIYSLGATLIYLLTHKDPPEMTSATGLLEFEQHCKISRDFETVLRKMTELQLDKRYASAAELRKDLVAILEGKPVSAGLQPQARRRWVVPALVSALLVALLFTYFNLRIEKKWSRRFQETRKVEAPVQPPAAVITPISAQGRVEFDGKPITDFTGLEPRFWFRNEKEGTVQTANVTYDKGKFFIRGLPPGEFGLSVQYDLEPANALSYPGDLRSWQTFQVTEGRVSEVQVQMRKIIHVIRPQDNGKPMEKWGADWSEMISHSSNLTFEWKSLGEDVFYDYKISRVKSPYTFISTETGGTVQATKVTIKLPPSKPNEYYIFELSARRQGREIGMLITHGSRGYGWDYRFRVN